MAAMAVGLKTNRKKSIEKTVKQLTNRLDLLKFSSPNFCKKKDAFTQCAEAHLEELYATLC